MSLILLPLVMTPRHFGWPGTGQGENGSLPKTLSLSRRHRRNHVRSWLSNRDKASPGQGNATGQGGSDTEGDRIEYSVGHCVQKTAKRAVRSSQQGKIGLNWPYCRYQRKLLGGKPPFEDPLLRQPPLRCLYASGGLNHFCECFILGPQIVQEEGRRHWWRRKWW